MEANLELLARFYEQYPEFTDKTFLSVKAGLSYNDTATRTDPDRY